MVEEELIYLIAESIYRNERESAIVIGERDYAQLSDGEKHVYLSMAHNIVAIVDNYYDEELLDSDLDEEDEEDIDLTILDDGYGEHLYWEG